jgi:hypothetical protein
MRQIMTALIRKELFEQKKKNSSSVFLQFYIRMPDEISLNLISFIYSILPTVNSAVWRYMVEMGAKKYVRCK